MKLQSNLMACPLFIIFLFVVTIVLFNLLNALAISDTQEILKEGELADLSMKIKAMHDREKSAESNKRFSWVMTLIQNKLTVIPRCIKGKLLLKLASGEIEAKKHFPKMDKNILEKLQAVAEDSIKRLELEQHVLEIKASLRNIESRLVEVLQRFEGS